MVAVTEESLQLTTKNQNSWQNLQVGQIEEYG
jgi:hypothetical protein